MALASGLPGSLAGDGYPPEIFQQQKIISPVENIQASSHWLHEYSRSERSNLSVIQALTGLVVSSQRIQPGRTASAQDTDQHQGNYEPS
ncbi:hypothetical protein SY86_23060 [Erwinia tracheiphila]|uniref:Uncharacterized protein n=1 Tax=Erwinia tracheiphila TaxID=65700 RepID=A0A0M2KJY0_9GAMM|nr:hypothetical protein ETR_20737 [Erwinia tracheiphila PSU-1]KKF37617.1 hypothetical protein SY86_23060 [Erwinia tracheiphila]